jgi:hypothetical protein
MNGGALNVETLSETRRLSVSALAIGVAVLVLGTTSALAARLPGTIPQDVYTKLSTAMIAKATPAGRTMTCKPRNGAEGDMCFVGASVVLFSVTPGKAGISRCVFAVSVLGGRDVPLPERTASGKVDVCKPGWKTTLPTLPTPAPTAPTPPPTMSTDAVQRVFRFSGILIPKQDGNGVSPNDVKQATCTGLGKSYRYPGSGPARTPFYTAFRCVVVGENMYADPSPHTYTVEVAVVPWASGTAAASMGSSKLRMTRVVSIA